MDGLGRAQPLKGDIVVAGAVADAIATPVKAGERHEQEIRIDNGRSLKGLANGHCANLSLVSRRPEAKNERRVPADNNRQGGRESLIGEPSQKPERVRLAVQRMESRDDLRPPELRESQTFIGKAAAESGVDVRLKPFSPNEGRAAQDRLLIGVGRSQGRRPTRKGLPSV
jgi:hypothetical protein